jgi:hypothetical protein
MKPFNLKIAQSLNLIIIPDSDRHMDGHPVLNYSYSIYKWQANDEIETKEVELHLENQMTLIIWALSFLKP